MIPGPRAGWPTEIQRLGRNKAWKLGRANSAGGGQRVAPRNFNNGYCLDTGSVTGLIKWRKPPLGAKKKKKKRRHGEKSGGLGEGRTSERRERTAYGCSLVNVFRAYYLFVIPYTTLAAPPSSRSMLLLLPFFFGFYFSFFFSRYLAISGLMARVIFFPWNCTFQFYFIIREDHEDLLPFSLESFIYLFLSLSFFCSTIMTNRCRDYYYVSRNPKGRLFLFFFLSLVYSAFYKICRIKRENKEREGRMEKEESW